LVTLLIGIVLVQLPWIAHLVRTATLKVSKRGYVRAAVARGERTPAVLGREILPNIVAPIIASAGPGFAYSVLMVASVNVLGLGLKPPTSDWGLMLSENRPILDTNPWLVLASAGLLGCLIISVNLITDADWQTVGSRSQCVAVAGQRPNLPTRTLASLSRVHYPGVEDDNLDKPEDRSVLHRWGLGFSQFCRSRRSRRSCHGTTDRSSRARYISGCGPRRSRGQARVSVLLSVRSS
jgi:hypothetical protein